VSIRTRFTFTVVAIVAVTVALFATLSIIALDRALHSGFRSGLSADAQAIATAVDVHDGRVSVDKNDLQALASLNPQISFAVYAAGGARVGGEAAPSRTQKWQSASAPVAREGHTYGWVTVWQSGRWIGDLERKTALVLSSVGLLLIALGAIASRRVAVRVLGPVAQIASLAEGIEANDLSGRLRVDGRDELGRLCATFDRMLDRLQGAFVRERRFVADASHELRAPLAVLQAETELALRRERTSGEYRAALASIEQEADRLEHLVDELLAAARAEVDANQRQAFDANALVSDIAARVRPAAAARNINVSVETNGEAVAHANRATLERALVAIAHNAVTYGRAEGTVKLRASAANDSVLIEIADDGAGFSNEALAHATERFWRGDTSRPRGGTGLGLAIARTMVEANRGTLALANAPKGGAKVIIEVPSYGATLSGDSADRSASLRDMISRTSGHV